MLESKVRAVELFAVVKVDVSIQVRRDKTKWFPETRRRTRDTRLPLFCRAIHFLAKGGNSHAAFYDDC
jgi:hypothetical protein